MSRFAVIDPANLGRMIILEDLDSDQTIVERLQQFKIIWATYDPPAAALYDVENLEFDPAVIIQEAGTFYEILLRDRVNQAARAVTLAFSSSTDLDAIASRYPGGVPRMEGESDERYRRRVWLSPNALSPHGNAEAYVLWALNSNAALRDATAIAIKGTGKIIVTILNEDVNNPKPSDAVIASTRAFIFDKARKGLTDWVIVQAPKVTQIRYRLKYWLFPGPEQTGVESAMRTSLEALVEKQRWLAYDHTRTWIDAAAAINGVQKVEIIEPAVDLPQDEEGFVQVMGIDLTYMGRNE